MNSWCVDRSDGTKSAIEAWVDILAPVCTGIVSGFGPRKVNRNIPKPNPGHDINIQYEKWGV